MKKFVVYITFRDKRCNKRSKHEFTFSSLEEVSNIILAFHIRGDILSIKVYRRK